MPPIHIIGGGLGSEDDMPDIIRQFMEEQENQGPKSEKDIDDPGYPFMEQEFKKPSSFQRRVMGEAINHVGEHLSRVFGEGFIADPKSEIFQFFKEVLLENAQTPDHIQDLISKYLDFCKGVMVANDMAQSGDNPISHIVNFSRVLPEIMGRREMGGNWEAVTQHARNRIMKTLTSGHENLNILSGYTKENGRDGALIIMSDPEVVGGLDPSEAPNITRDIPNKKRMTKEKLARLVQLPGIFSYIKRDLINRNEFTVGSNLAILGEYFCETDKVMEMNKVTPEDIDTWIKEKLKKHNPSLEVARYLWARLQGTEFEKTSFAVEQYILDLHQREHSWIFDLTGMKRENLKQPGAMFELYMEAVRRCDSDKTSRVKLLPFLPSESIMLAGFKGGKKYPKVTESGLILPRPVEDSYRDSRPIKDLLKYINNHLYEFCEDIQEEDIDKNFVESCKKILLEDTIGTDKWDKIDGFELLDPIIIKRMNNGNRLRRLMDLTEKMRERIVNIKPAELLEIRKILDMVSRSARKNLEEFLDDIGKKIAADYAFIDVPDQAILEVARGEREVDEIPNIILPGNVEFRQIVSQSNMGRLNEELAELALVKRHLSTVRGGEEIIQFLMQHIDTMRPSELIIPSVRTSGGMIIDGPNQEIIREFADSPDLLALLQMATILLYLGYSPEDIMKEIKEVAELAEQEAKSEITTAGLELEQIGATNENMIINESRYSTLFNAMPMGNDRISNEIMTSPTVSAIMQKLFLMMITDPRFEFLNTEALWKETETPGRRPNSIHVNTAIPKELPFGYETTYKYMQPLMHVNWLAQGGDPRNSQSQHKTVNPWRPNSLLDVLKNKHPRQKVEFRGLALKRDQSHLNEIRELQNLSSAAIQLMKEHAHLPTTTSGKVLAQIYEQFCVEARSVFSGDKEQIVIRAKELIKKYSKLVEDELNRKESKKPSGIMTM